MSELLLTVCIFIAAVLYSSVGHGGASGYLAAMALFGVAPAVMKPTALVLNIIVAAIATLKFYRAGYFKRSLFIPFAIGSIPCAFIGGSIVVPTQVYKPILGLVLFYAAAKLGFIKTSAAAQPPRPISLYLAIGLGMAIGLLSGLTGVGGGIFLSPLLLLMGWATIPQSAG
ncbi:sulfite exporter TauE/SafE family protein, partial [Chamaesiphon sp. VAR_69_metabat_338]|uniref:sulfite exporter TauE/SafE family protein n=1 Tax=Chamaesiphon sp. VAR_69_metabat_338 TaxID=2964704 RepID=UPI00286E6E51